MPGVVDRKTERRLYGRNRTLLEEYPIHLQRLPCTRIGETLLQRPKHGALSFEPVNNVAPQSLPIIKRRQLAKYAICLPQGLSSPIKDLPLESLRINLDKEI